MRFPFLATKNCLSKALVNPEVDEEVGEVVDVRKVEEVARDAPAKKDREDEGEVADDCQDEKACSNFHRLYVLSFLLR